MKSKLNRKLEMTKKARKPMSAERKAALVAGLAKARAAKASGSVNAPMQIAVRSDETDEQILEKLEERFSAMDKVVNATLEGITRATIISGPAGLGKSFGVMAAAEGPAGEGKMISFIKGFVRPTGLYKALYEHRAPGCVLVFDDADSIFGDDVALNLLKGACDMTKKRTISWRAETKMEDEAGDRLPTSFDFEGSIVFITNMDFDWHIAKGTRLSPHFEAMISRAMYLDLGMKTRRDYFIRIQMVIDAMMEPMGFGKEDVKEMLEFIEQHFDKLRELSLRMVIKLSTLMRADRKSWKNDARILCFKAQ